MSEEADDGYVAVDETAFYKQLPSDIEDAVSLALLTQVSDTNEMWHEFQEEDIQQVVETFSVLKMSRQYCARSNTSTQQRQAGHAEQLRACSSSLCRCMCCAELLLSAGEKLITKGEYATFCGIVLQGTFTAIVSPTLHVPLRAGELVVSAAEMQNAALWVCRRWAFSQAACACLLPALLLWLG